MQRGNESVKRITREGGMIAVDTNLLVYAHREDSPFEAWIEVGPLGRDRRLLAGVCSALEQGRISVLKSMMLASQQSAAIMAFASCGLPIATLAASRHSPSLIHWWGKDER